MAIPKQSTLVSTLTIVPGSGTGELKGIAGAGTSVATPKSCNCELDHELS
jgi:hypothetical protein